MESVGNYLVVVVESGRNGMLGSPLIVLFRETNNDRVSEADLDEVVKSLRA